MKKISILMLVSMLLLTVLSFGQTITATTPHSKTVILLSDVTPKTAAQKLADTLANATTKTQTAKIADFNDLVTVQTFLAKITGTPAGKVYLQGSINGTDFARAGGDDSLTVYNLPSQSKTFYVSPSKFTFYRIQYIGTGTQSVRFNSIALIRKK